MRKELLDRVELAKARSKAKKQANKMNILAIDPATLCGWAIESTEFKGYECGVWNLTKRKDESDGIKWLRFRAQLKEICSMQKIQIVAFERPAGQHQGAVIHHAKLVAIIEEFCADNAIEYKAYSAGQIKKFATGKGNSGKPIMIQAAKDKLGYEGDDDNEADALWLLQLAKSELI